MIDFLGQSLRFTCILLFTFVIAIGVLGEIASGDLREVTISEQTYGIAPEASGDVHFFHRRDYNVVLLKAGFYKIAITYPYEPRKVEMTLDGQFLYHYLQRMHLDPSQARPSKLSFNKGIGVVRYLTKGKHTLTLSGYQGTYPFVKKDVNRFFKLAHLSVKRLSASKNLPSETLSIYAKGRRDLIFRKDEPLIVRVEQATKKSTVYQMQVVEQRGDGKVLWSAKVTLAGASDHAVAELIYPCHQEGAFEYTLTNQAGKVVDGPWALVVIDPTLLATPKAAQNNRQPRQVLVDQVDCTQPNDQAHKFRSNGTSKVIKSKAGNYRVTGKSYKKRVQYKVKPLSKGGGLARLKPGEKGNSVAYAQMDWFAYTLKVKHPTKPHMVVAYVPNDVKRLVSVWGYDQVTGNYNMGSLQAGDAPYSKAFSKIRFLMWPNSNAIDILTFCDSNLRLGESFWRQGAISKIELYELPDGLGTLGKPVKGFAKDKEFGWAGEQVNLGMEQAMMPPLWKDNAKVPGVVIYQYWGEGPYHDWRALMTVWDRFGQLSRWRGDHLLIWPVNSYSMGRLGELSYMERDFESYTRTYRSRMVDPMRRDQLKMILLICEKYGIRFVPDFQMSRLYDYVLLATDSQKKYTAKGLFVTDAQGKVVIYPARILNPAHPLARQYLLGWVNEIAEHYGQFKSFGGINIRQRGWYTNNSAYFHDKTWGYGDFTVSLFEKETGCKLPTIANDANRFKKRRKYLLTQKKDIWFKWRNNKVSTLRKAMFATLRKHAPQARLYGSAANYALDPNSGSGIDPKLIGDRDLGYGKTLRPTGPHIENPTLDPIAFANFDIREPKSIRYTFNKAINRAHVYGSNPCAGNQTSLRPYPYQLEPLAKALAKSPLETLLLGGPWVVPSLDEGIRRWSQAWQAIPKDSYLRVGNLLQKNEPVVAWQAAGHHENKLTFYLVNTTPVKRVVRVEFDRQPATATNLLWGKVVNTNQIAIDPYMVAVVSAIGVTTITKIEVLNNEVFVAGGQLTTKGKKQFIDNAAASIGPLMMDQFEITNDQYEQFDPAHKSLRGRYSSLGSSPAIYVSWQEAIRYCNWRSLKSNLQPCYNEKTGDCDLRKNGYRLPTELEWQYAAVGRDGRPYPWGNQKPHTKQVYRANLAPDTTNYRVDPNMTFTDGYQYAAPVGSFNAYQSVFGISDLVGNVWEWTQPTKNKHPFVLRGGAWTTNLRTFHLSDRRVLRHDVRANNIGFRCVRNAK